MTQLIPNCSEWVTRIKLTKTEHKKLTALVKTYCGVSTICDGKESDVKSKMFNRWLNAKNDTVIFFSEIEAPKLKRLLKEVKQDGC